jgi:folate-binding protein YgfZ
MKPSFEHPINTRLLSTFTSINTELELDATKNYLFDLSYLGILNVEGEKAIDFLQGQLTCDLRIMSDIKMIQGAQCNLKGRILSLLDIINWNGIKLILPNDLMESTHHSLNKTALLSRVSLKENKQLKIFGFYLQNSQDLLPDTTFLPTQVNSQAYGAGYCYYHLGNGFYIFILGEECTDNIMPPFIATNQLLGSLTWHTLRLYQRQINIYPESRGLFLPHRLDLHQTSYLSFDKGCYKGQEIIARTHYRATLKHELKIYKVRSEGKIYSGQKLFSATEDRELGELVDYSYLANNSYLIAASMLKESENTVRMEGSSDLLVLEQCSNC